MISVRNVAISILLNKHPEKKLLFFQTVDRHVAVFDGLVKRTEFPRAAKSRACDLIIYKTH